MWPGDAAEAKKKKLPKKVFWDFVAPQWAVSPSIKNQQNITLLPFFKGKAKGSKVGSSLNGFLQAEDVEIIQLEWDLTETAAADFNSIILLSFCGVI